MPARPVTLTPRDQIQAPEIRLPRDRSHIIVMAIVLVSMTPVAAKEQMDWATKKCRLCREAYEKLLHRGLEGIGPAFLDGHEAFFAANCQSKAAICPRSTQEFDFANTLVIVSMNHGMASTFVPFACR